MSHTLPIKKRRRNIERDLPTRLDAVVPESRLYTRLLNFERRLDATIVRKQVQQQQSVHGAPREKFLRLFLSNETHNQSKEGVQDTEEQDETLAPPSWTMRIQGFLVDPATGVASRNPHFPLSNFISKMVVQLDPRLYEAREGFIEWRKETSVALSDGFEIKRLGQEDCEVKVSIWLDTSPKEFKVIKSLQKLLGVDKGTVNEVVKALWHYIQENELQAQTNPLEVHLDRDLQKLLGTAEAIMPIKALAAEMQQFLGPADPLVFKYVVRMDTTDGEADLYDLKMKVPETIRFGTSSPCSPFEARSPQYANDLQRVQDKILSTISDINRHTRRREFLMAFAEAPLEVTNMMVSGQAKEIIAVNQELIKKENDRMASAYQKDWVPDAVDRYLREHVPSNKRAKPSSVAPP